MNKKRNKLITSFFIKVYFLIILSYIIYNKPLITFNYSSSLISTSIYNNTFVVSDEIHFYNQKFIKENINKRIKSQLLSNKNRKLQSTPSPENNLGDIKCKTSTNESAIYKLCTSCNTDQHYYPAEFTDKKLQYLDHNFVECYNNQTKPNNYYFDSNETKYKLCYFTCSTCEKGGNGDINNCITCDSNHIKKPGFPNTTNCVTECLYSYYYTPYGYYKCNNNSNCPEEANLYIKELKKCTSDCKKEEKHIFQYGGQCFETCPIYTSPNEDNICTDNNTDSCAKSENEIDLKEFLTNGGIDISAKTYAKEFGYTTKHVTHLYNSIYSILFYKDSNCIDQLKLNMPKIDFGNCYNKVLKSINTTTNKLITALIEKSNGQKKSSISYSFYHPETGEKLDAQTICQDEQIVIKESVLNQLNNSDVDLNSVLYLTQQDINVFNLSDEFYTDICYHFESPNGKDVPLADRIHSFYPNITLCDTGCNCKGVDLNTMESICECTFNSIINNEFIEGNALISSALGEITDILSSSNLLVLKCYKDVFKKEYMIKSWGGFIMIGIAFFEIIFALIFMLYELNNIRKYLLNLTQYYITYVSENKTSSTFKNAILVTGNKAIKSNPTKKLKRGKSQKNIKINLSLNDLPKKGKKKLKSKSKKINPKNNSGGKSIEKSSNKFLRRAKSKKLEVFNFSDETSKSKNSSKLLKIKELCGNIDMEEYLKPDLDDMEFDDAIKLDKRTFCEFLSDRLKEKQIILDTFCNKENLRPISIKIMLLLLNIDLYFVINGFFFNEEYISQLFNSTEEETFFSYFPRSYSNFFYATLVSVIISIIMSCIFVEEKKVKRIFLREKDNPVQLKYEISMDVNDIKRKYTVFSFICLFIAVISWYYVSCFNNVYPGVKIEWIKSSVTIIIIMQILSILVAFLEAILRAISFEYKSEKVYKARQLLS